MVPYRFRPFLAMGLALSLLGACMQGGSGEGASAGAAPKPDYVTYSDHFVQLQKAGLTGNYDAFVGLLKPADPAPVVAELRRSFRGKPFDVYTRKADASGSAHKRLVELRSSDGRLYLYMKLDKVPGGWKVAGYELGRNKAAMSARL